MTQKVHGMEHATAQNGRCPACHDEGLAGTPCPTVACRRQQIHRIPNDYVHIDPFVPAPLPDPMAGQIIDDYLVVQVIGAGGFAQVYLGLRVPQLEIKCAIKVLAPPSTEAARTQATKLDQEASALARLQHSNIVHLISAGQFRDRSYLVMEYVEGGRTLRDEIEDSRAKGGALEPGLARHILSQVLYGLGAAHTAGIVHRDIKPENVMLTAEWGYGVRVKLLDFGLAKIATDSRQTAHVFGTPVYMAPEQLTQGAIGPWTDLYAVGVVALEMVAGTIAFSELSPQAVVTAKVHPLGDPFGALIAERVPEHTQPFFRKALAREPSERFHSARELLDALEPVLSRMAEEAPGGKLLPFRGRTTQQVDIAASRPVAVAATATAEPARRPAAGSALAQLIAAEGELEPLVSLPTPARPVLEPAELAEDGAPAGPITPSAARRPPTQTSLPAAMSPDRRVQTARHSAVQPGRRGLSGPALGALGLAVAGALVYGGSVLLGGGPEVPSLALPSATESTAQAAEATAPPAGELSASEVARILEASSRDRERPTQAEPPHVDPRASESIEAARRAAKSGQTATAIAHMEKAIRLAPAPELHRELAELYAKNDDRRQAVRHYRAYLEAATQAADASQVQATIDRLELRRGQ
jgi:serine/threonine-protein kinase